MDLTHYIPFLQLLTDGKLTFYDFEKYSFDKLLKIRRVHSLGIYLKNKMNEKINDDL
jgi:hypothetical protein